DDGGSGMSEQGGAGRYTRSFNGMVGAMVFIVGLVLLLVLFRTLISDPPDQSRPPTVDYLDSVQGLQQNGFEIFYPETLPDGWVATEVGAELGEDQSYRINLYTDDDDFVGIRQENAVDITLDDMLEEYVDESTTSEDPLVGVGTLASTWEGWSDEGGDRAYSTAVDGSTVLVFGTVSVEDLTELIELLGTDEVPTS
uniref:DUF4245 family protein n=1 Tax=Nocardioides sp. TaxID=35761 RepID=UPI002B27665A